MSYYFPLCLEISVGNHSEMTKKTLRIKWVILKHYSTIIGKIILFPLIDISNMVGYRFLNVTQVHMAKNRSNVHKLDSHVNPLS